MYQDDTIDTYNKLSNFCNTAEEDSAKSCSSASKEILLMRRQFPPKAKVFPWAECLDWTMTVNKHTKSWSSTSMLAAEISKDEDYALHWKTNSQQR